MKEDQIKNRKGVQPFAALKGALIFLVLCGAYFISGKLGLRLAIVNASATAVWPPTGIALAAILLIGYRVWPAIFIGAFFTNVTTAGTILTSLGIASGNTLEALIGAYLINRFAGGKNVFGSLANIFKFTLLGGGVSTAVSATVGVVTLALSGLTSWESLPSVWTTWWLGDATGNLVFAPVIILWATQSSVRWNYKRIIEASLLAALLLFVGLVVFGGSIPKGYPLDFLVAPIIAWAAFRFREREAATVTVLLAGIALWGTLEGFGPFVRLSANESLLILQAFMGFNSIVGIALASVVSDRRREEERFHALIEYSYDAISIIDESTKVLYASPSTERILGYAPDEFVGMNGLSLVYGADVEKTAQALAGLAKEPGAVAVIQVRVKRKDGAWIWVECNIRNLFYEPSIAAIVVNYRDITEQKESEKRIEEYAEQVAREKAKDEAILHSIGEGMVVVDREKNILFLNEQAEILLGWRSEDAVGKKIFEVLPVEDEDGKEVSPEQRAISLAMMTGKKVATDAAGATFYYVRKDKKRFPALFTATPVVLDGKIVGAIDIFRDVTAEKAVDQAKNELLSLVSHQLRTPLSIVKWCSEKLLASHTLKATESEAQCLADIHTSNQKMVKLVDAILSVARIEMGAFDKELTRVNFVEIARACLHELHPAITAKKITVEEHISEHMPISMSGQKSVEAIFQNLLSNAIQYTPAHGKITLGIGVVDFENKGDGAFITVADTGYGIPEAQKEKIFTKLFRADNIKRRQSDGTGLGLYIVKLLVDQLGGKIWFESEEGKGTIFHVILPIHTENKHGTE